VPRSLHVRGNAVLNLVVPQSLW